MPAMFDPVIKADRPSSRIEFSIGRASSGCHPLSMSTSEVDQRVGHYRLAMRRAALQEGCNGNRCVQRAYEVVRRGEVGSTKNELIDRAEVAEQPHQKGEIQPHEQAGNELIVLGDGEP
ncbi:MAG: hypothetical protein ABI640_01590 [Gammaproteobacteria bacterium]